VRLLQLAARASQESGGAGLVACDVWVKWEEEVLAASCSNNALPAKKQCFPSK
jgi:hypothetical protein